MDEIQCLACGETLELPKFIDTNNYDGQLVCQECKALLYLKLVKGKVRKYKIDKGPTFNMKKHIADASRKFDEVMSRPIKRQEEDVDEEI